MLNVLTTTLAATHVAYYSEWLLMGILLFIGAAFGLGNVVISHLQGPARKGRVKDSSYESGVDPLGSTKDRFNVRFYLVAMIFLVLIPLKYAFTPGVHIGNQQN